MVEYILVISTCQIDDADALAQKLVESKTCACVNIVRNVTSVYHWKDKIESDSECILLMKTEKRLRDALWEVLRENHTYEVPEFVVIPIQDGSLDYLNWISESTLSN